MKSLVSEFWKLAKYYDIFWSSVLSEISARYVGSILGVIWVVVFPLLQLSIYGILYTLIFKIRVPGLSEIQYVILVFSGLVPLLAFSDSINGAISSLSANKSLLLNTVFPAELIPVRASISAHIPMLFGLAITLILGISFGNSLSWALLLVPFLWVLLILFALGLGWILSLLTLVLRDIQHGIGLVIMMLIFLSPFAYTPEMVPEGLRFILYFNPLSYYVMSFQQVICYGTFPSISNFLPCVFLSFSTFLIGFKFFKATKTVFFDHA